MNSPLSRVGLLSRDQAAASYLGEIPEPNRRVDALEAERSRREPVYRQILGLRSATVPVPPLDPITGLLRPGIHVATLAEVRVAFGSANDTRAEIMDGLERLVVVLRTVGVFKEIYLDGSFVTDKAIPGDVDAIAVMNDDNADLPVFAAHPAAFQLADDKRVKRDYKVQLFLGPRGASLLSFFQGLKAADALLRGVPPTQKKGILKVIL